MSAQSWAQVTRTAGAVVGCVVLVAALATPAQAQQRKSARAQVSVTIVNGAIQHSVVDSAMRRLEAQTAAPEGQAIPQVTALYLAQGARLVSQATALMPDGEPEHPASDVPRIERVVTLEYVAN